MASSVIHASFTEMPSPAIAHFHDCHQLIYIVQGEALMFFENKSRPVKEGTLALFNRFEEHSVLSEKNSSKRYIIKISPELLHTVSRNPEVYSFLIDRKEGFENCINAGDKKSEIESILKKLTNEFNSDNPLRDELMSAYLKELLITLGRLIPDNLSKESSALLKTVNEIRRHLESDYSKSHKLESIASEFSLSKSHLSHIFKKVTGTSVMNYLLNCRMNAAKILLSETEKPISEIVSECGFPDESNFCRMFKSLNKATPSAFRKENRNRS